MKLSCILKKTLFRKTVCDLTVNGIVVARLVSGQRTDVELADCERYYISLGDKVCDALTVLLPEGDTISLTVTRGKKSFSLDALGARIEVISLERLLCAMYDEGQILSLCPWEKNAFFALSYAGLNREDAILESPYLLQIRDALACVGDTEIAERLTRVIERCEISLPLIASKKLTPEEQTALVESYHLLWCEAEAVEGDEELRSLLRVYDYIYEKQKENGDA